MNLHNCSFSHIITVANLIIWLIDKLFHRFSVINKAALPEFIWKGLNLLKDGNKRF